MLTCLHNMHSCSSPHFSIFTTHPQTHALRQGALDPSVLDTPDPVSTGLLCPCTPFPSNPPCHASEEPGSGHSDGSWGGGGVTFCTPYMGKPRAIPCTGIPLSLQAWGNPCHSIHEEPPSFVPAAPGKTNKQTNTAWPTDHFSPPCSGGRDGVSPCVPPQASPWWPPHPNGTV